MKQCRIGTDCSGIEAPIQAIQKIGISYEHVFSSDIDKYVIKSIKENYNPKRIFGDKNGLYPEGDITKRNIRDIPDIDVYVCGFPCQAFSSAGKRKGFADKRGIVFFSCLEVIYKKEPKFFILENVKGLLTHDKGYTFKVIIDELKSLEKYNIYWKVLNTYDYGIPQSRPRVYIVGILKKIQIEKFYWPKKKKLRKLSSFIDEKDNTVNEVPKSIKEVSLLDRIPNDAVFVDFSFKNNNFPMSGTICPCILSNHMIWCVPKHRYINIKERLSLQGFPKNFKQVVSNTQLKKQIGNSMSVNVLVEIFKICFKCIIN